jgi:hypothetical protein
MPNESIRRPLGATMLALGLVFAAFSGFGNAVAWRAIPSEALLSAPGSIAPFLRAMHSLAFSEIACFYGIAALVAAISLWRLDAWMHRAFLVWSFFVVLMLGFMVLNWPGELGLGGLIGGATIGALGLAILWLFSRYIRSVNRRSLSLVRADAP